MSGPKGAAEVIAALLARVGLDLPVRLRAWDGSEAGPLDAPVLVARSPRVLRRILWRPGELGLARTTLRITGREDFGAHYAETLRIWRERFGAQADRVASLGFDEVFNRMWTFYLCYSEAGFRAGYIDVSQLTLARTSP